VKLKLVPSLAGRDAANDSERRRPLVPQDKLRPMLLSDRGPDDGERRRPFVPQDKLKRVLLSDGDAGGLRHELEPVRLTANLPAVAGAAKGCG